MRAVLSERDPSSGSGRSLHQGLWQSLVARIKDVPERGAASLMTAEMPAQGAIAPGWKHWAKHGSRAIFAGCVGFFSAQQLLEALGTGRIYFQTKRVSVWAYRTHDPEWFALFCLVTLALCLLCAAGAVLSAIKLFVPGFGAAPSQIRTGSGDGNDGGPKEG